MPLSPWYLVESDIKKHARLNMISHLLSTIRLPRTTPRPVVNLPERPIESHNYIRPPRELLNYVPDFAGKLLGGGEGEPV